MKLIYHPFSPFSRKVYMLALELNLASSITLQKVVVAPVFYPGWSDNNLDVSAAGNPLGKIPVLVVDDFADDDGDGDGNEGDEGKKPVGIFDSKFICEYLLSRAGRDDGQGKSARTRWLEKSVHGACDGMADAEILVAYEQRLRADKGLLYQAWVDGQREKVTRGFRFLDAVAAAATATASGLLRPARPDRPASVAEIAAATTCAFFDLRDFPWRPLAPSLEAWFEQWKSRPSFELTPPTAQHWFPPPAAERL
ncbi:uncharacterized protein PV09_02478 [Verruconis gallopava]|uniref:GST N-terminal domain-containing protein n=1 Tax=Verruconis gallopava TaxID=253628 RepID=A0A0D2AIR8_9PEZI|nr:uncharacterized protein PV09_02478 [Verruconis gallopava]KIW06798.1 hypothetical protein PV09_02478 [Verruconis gallopava]